MENNFTEVINRVLSGEHRAYGELYDRTIQDVYKNVHFLIDNSSDVEDLVQDIYVQVYKSLGKFDCHKSFKPWLIGIAIKQVQAYRRKNWMRIRIVKKAEDNKQQNVEDFSEDVVNKIINEPLMQLVKELPFKLKQVIILRYLNDYSQEEVATILDIPIGTVKSRINAALKKLRTNVISENTLNKKVGMYRES